MVTSMPGTTFTRVLTGAVHVVPLPRYMCNSVYIVHDYFELTRAPPSSGQLQQNTLTNARWYR